MRIAFLCKRRYTGKDVIGDRFGRLHEIPLQLAFLGHEVKGFCLDYHHQSYESVTYDVEPGHMSWESRSLGRTRLSGIFSYPRQLLHRVHSYCPEILLGASDIPHAVLTAWLSKRLGVPYALDLYDNFESFGQALIPGAVSVFRKAVRDAQLVITVSDPLRNWIQSKYSLAGEVHVMPNAVDKKLFKAGNRMDARLQLKLPLNAELIGTAGGLYRSKGVAELYAAWPTIAAKRPDAHLVLAGPQESSLALPKDERVHYLGNLTHPQVADLFSALNVGVVTVSDSNFGRFCFPQKAYEMMACGLPLVAANVGVMSGLLENFPKLLYVPSDAESLVNAAIYQLDAQVKVQPYIKDWAELVAELEPKLVTLQNKFVS